MDLIPIWGLRHRDRDDGRPGAHDVDRAARERAGDRDLVGRGRAASAVDFEAESWDWIEGSRRIVRCRIELYVWLKHAGAWDEVGFQTDAIGVLEQHRIVTRRPCSLLRGLDYGGPNLPK